MILCLSVLNRYHISIHMLAINLQVSYTLFRIIRILNVEVISGTAEAAGEGEVTEALRNTRIDGKSVIGWLHTQDCLGEVHESPCGCSGKPCLLYTSDAADE